RVHFPQIALADLPRARHEARDLFQALEFDHAVKGELQLERVHHVHHNHFAAAEAQMLNALDNLLLVVKQIADQHNNAAAADLSGQLVQNTADPGGLTRIKRRQGGHDVMDRSEIAGARQVLAHRLIENADRDGIALVQYQVRQAGCQLPAV